jgi:phosphatidate cytidylyltransferase
MTTSDAPPVGRAGRNLPAAIGVGLGLGALVLGTLYSPARWTFVVVIAAASVVGTLEVLRALRQLGAQPPVVPVLVGGTAMVLAGYRYGAEEVFLALTLTSLACVLWRLAEPAAGLLRDVTAAVFVAAYVPFLAGFCALLAAPPDGPRRVTAFIATVVCSDVGGYAAGVLLGKHPMAPTVSPKKSWEGFAGSVVFCVAAGLALAVYLLEADWWIGVALGLITVVMATLGDLCESVIKRDLGIKDMSQVIPGHGGLMDRLDSLLATIAPIWLLLHYLVF